MVLAVGLAACGEPSGGGASDDGEQPYRVDAFVLDDGSGAVLCLGGVADSLPPQCDGIPLEGWDWDAVEDEDSQAGQRWGQFDVVGTYDGTTFTVLEAGPPQDVGPRADPIDWTACDEPPGGWEILDPTRVSDDDMVATMQAARREQDYSGFWIDDGGGPGGVTIINVAFTGDLDAHEAVVRETWGGPVCMVEHARTYSELRRIQREVSDPTVAVELGIDTTWSGTDQSDNVVEVGVVVATDEARAAVAERYGEGAVELFPALIPLEDAPEA